MLSVIAYMICFCVGAAQAQPYPSRPITIVVALPAGGAVDALARIIAEPMR
jgi:tripartite-type tricarboxylate transporter receptor subunit TctC